MTDLLIESFEPIVIEKYKFEYQDVLNLMAFFFTISAPSGS